MIRQDFTLPKYRWSVRVYYDATEADKMEIIPILVGLGCSGENLDSAYRNIGTPNWGLTVSNLYLKRTAIVISRAYTLWQFVNTYDHEKGHMCSDIREAYSIDDKSEEAQYLAGDVGEKMFAYGRLFLCGCGL